MILSSIHSLFDLIFEKPTLRSSLGAEASTFYQIEAKDIEGGIQIRRKNPCPCDSDKKYKNCCEPHA